MPEETLESKRIFKGRMLGLRDDTVRLPNGETSKREICEHPGAVTIVAVTPDKKIVLVKQFRKAVESDIYEIPAGLINKDEPFIEAAKRELEEETGYLAGKIEPILETYTSPGYSTEVLRFFYATNLTKTKQALDQDEFVEVEEFELDQAYQMVEQGKIKDAKTILGVLWLRCRS